MALVCCTECGQSVSDRAASCPKCGNPIGDRVQTVQQTSKAIKLVILLSFVSMISGCFGVMLNMPEAGAAPAVVERQAEATMPFTFMFVIGSVVFVASKLSQWWHHG
jgi:uncharacterized paraquat-inducible protein A